ncbi:MAG: AAA family ATPase, partial [Planctomycetota bacterium]
MANAKDPTPTPPPIQKPAKSEPSGPADDAFSPGKSVGTGPSKPSRSVGDVLQEFSQHVSTMRAELGKVVIGQEDVVQQMLAAIFTRGHCLLEGVPGLAKTLMVSTLSQILDVSFK